jgi:rSAM/selenodomain-associated transferase 1
VGLEVLPAQLLVLAKAPRAGFSKTRLTPPLTPEQAADVARASLEDTLAVALDTPVARRTVVLDGPSGPWLPPGFDVQPQSPGPFWARLTEAFATAYDSAALPMLLIGMDTPQVTTELLTGAVEALLTPGTDAVLGLAEDGGWWALGLRRPHPQLFEGIEMSTSRTGAQQVARLAALGLRTQALPVLRDVDEVSDLRDVVAQLPAGTRLSRCVAGLAVSR